MVQQEIRLTKFVRIPSVCMGAAGANTVISISLDIVTNPESWKHQRSFHYQLCKFSGSAFV